MAKLTVIGLYNYAESKGIDLFDGLELPTELDRDVAVNNILLKCGDFECVYPAVDFLHSAITLWCKKWKRTFFKWNDALQIQYDALNNYDRKEEYTDVFKNTGSVNSITSSSATSGNSTTNNVSAYDSNELSTHDIRIDSGSNTANANDNSNSASEGETKHTAHLFGNIGVTTSQEMLKAELEISQWNIYDHIADLFLTEFIIPIY